MWAEALQAWAAANQALRMTGAIQVSLYDVVWPDRLAA